MSSTIQGTGLFAEAAYGPDGAPGQGGVTGAGEAHELAWKEALAAAGSEIIGQSGNQASGDAAALVQGGSGAIDDGLSTNGMKDSHPLSWDRLSMTVASMVAWNMQVGLSDDLPDDVIAGGSGAHTDSPLMPSVELDGGPFGAGGSVAEIGSGETNAATLTPFDQVGLAGDEFANGLSKKATNLNETLTGEDGISSLPSESSQASTVLREGPETHQGPVVVQGTPTDSSMVEGIPSADRQTGTASQAQATAAIRADSAVTVPEIPTLPTTSADGAAVLKGTAVAPSGFESNGSTSQLDDGRPEVNLIKQVSSTSVDSKQVNQGIERLSGIRSMLAELDNQAQLRSAVASVQQTTAERDQVARTAAISTVALAKDTAVQTAVSASASANGQISAHKARSPGIGNESAPAEDGRTFGTTTEGDDDMPGVTAQRLNPELRPREQRMATTRVVQQDVQVSSSGAENNAAFIGTGNAEITAAQDTMIETATVAAETIEASEVPELPINDPSQIDFDLDDPAGTVRVSMTRDAEEVAVRLETPNEVLEEYKEMRGEMDEAIGQQGLELGDFSASAHGEDAEAGIESSISEQDKSSRGEINQDIKGQQNLEQSGDTARLVNHIV